jgi:hypothetical protein
MSIGAIQSLSPARVASANPAQRRQMLRQAIDEVVGATFYGPMLKMARDNPFKGEFGHGGRGEEIFGAQLDMELARRASHTSRNSLSDAIYRRLEKGL